MKTFVLRQIDDEHWKLHEGVGGVALLLVAHIRADDDGRWVASNAEHVSCDTLTIAVATALDSKGGIDG